MTSKVKLWSLRITMVIASAVIAYLGGAIINQVSATTKPAATESAHCGNDVCAGGWFLGYCRDSPGSGGGCDALWLLGCGSYDCDHGGSPQ